MITGEIATVFAHCGRMLSEGDVAVAETNRSCSSNEMMVSNLSDEGDGQVGQFFTLLRNRRIFSPSFPLHSRTVRGVIIGIIDGTVRICKTVIRSKAKVECGRIR